MSALDGEGREAVTLIVARAGAIGTYASGLVAMAGNGQDQGRDDAEGPGRSRPRSVTIPAENDPTPDATVSAEALRTMEEAARKGMVAGGPFASHDELILRLSRALRATMAGLAREIGKNEELTAEVARLEGEGRKAS